MGDYKYGVGIEPHRRWPVAWYNPLTLWHTAMELLSSTDMVRNADPREMWTGVFEAWNHSADADADGAFWFDFLSDTGDGGNATFIVARAALADDMGHEHLLPLGSETVSSAEADGAESLEGSQFKRGKVLFLGGDLCYPGGSQRDFQYRFLEMFEGARPTAGKDPAGRYAYSIAQNHDWFDSALTFRRYFVNRSIGEFVGVDTPQTRTYFATRLPHNWWVLGLDFALVHDLDRGQYEAFRRLAGDPVGGVDLPKVTIKPGDQVILIYPEPYWTRPLGDDAPEGYPKRYQRLEAILQRQGIKVRMRLAGDVHHYVRESSAPDDRSRDDMLVTCGTGGAFLHPTHARALSRAKVMAHIDNPDGITEELRDFIQVGTVATGSNVSNVGPNYQASEPYPPKSVSRDLCWHNFLAMFKFGWNGIYPLRGSLASGIGQGNILFSLLLGMIYAAAINANSLEFSDMYRSVWEPDGLGAFHAVHHLSISEFLYAWCHSLLLSPFAVSLHLLLAALCFAIALGEEHVVAGGLLPLGNFLLQVMALASIFWFTFHWHPLLATGAHLIGGVLIGGMLFGIHFCIASSMGWMWNNAFSPLACEDYKGFLRFRIDAAGTLTGYFFGCDKVPRQWKRNQAFAGKVAGDVRPAWTEADGQAKAQWRLVDQFELRR